MHTGALKHISYEDLRKCILRCDTTVLTENLLQSMINYIPPPDMLNRLKEFESDYDNLAEAEQFAISISGIKRLVPRYIKSFYDLELHSFLTQSSLAELRSSNRANEKEGGGET